MATIDDRLLTRREAAALLAMAPHTLAQWLSRGEGPPVYRIGGRARYRREDLDRFIEERKAR